MEGGGAGAGWGEGGGDSYHTVEMQIVDFHIFPEMAGGQRGGGDPAKTGGVRRLYCCRPRAVLQADRGVHRPHADGTVRKLIARLFTSVSSNGTRGTGEVWD